MRHLLFATAGHVDHGKTTLIKTLTGKDTDRLPEEKRRGLSIDIGFSYLEFPEIGICAELIDVPGHERFIKNAIAGMAGAKALILVVDVLEGIREQTREHLIIAKATGISHIIGVITKIDRSDRELLERRRVELADFLESWGFSGLVVEFSPFREETRDRVVDAVREVASSLEPHPLDAPLRIHVDSAFSVKGFGTVIRGSMVSGTLREGDYVVIEPGSMKGRVRKIQNHGKFIEKASAGQRVALNIPDIGPKDVSRGSWVLRAGEYSKSENLIIKSDTPLRNGGIYSLFIGMGEIRGRVREISEGIYLFKGQREAVAFRGDRVLILNSEGRPVGGGEVIHPAPINLKRKFITQNLSDLLGNFDLYLKKERPPEKKREIAEEPVDPEAVRKLVDLTSRRITEEKDLLEDGIPREAIRYCVKRRMVHRLGTSLIISDKLLRSYVEKLKASGETIDIRKAKEALGLTRKFTVPLLEYLDYLGITLRKGNYRVWKGRG